MTRYDMIGKILRRLPAALLGAFLVAFTCGTSLVYAAETGAQAAPDDSSALVMVLLGGMLVIIIAVVLSVVASVVSSIASVEAGDEA